MKKRKYSKHFKLNATGLVVEYSYSQRDLGKNLENNEQILGSRVNAH